jgi:hypothetical protein
MQEVPYDFFNFSLLEIRVFVGAYTNGLRAFEINLMVMATDRGRPVGSAKT